MRAPTGTWVSLLSVMCITLMSFERRDELKPTNFNSARDSKQGSRGNSTSIIRLTSLDQDALQDKVALLEEENAMLRGLLKNYSGASILHDSPTEPSSTNEPWKDIVPIAVMYMPYAGYDNFSISTLTESFDKSYQNGLEESPFIRLANFSETADLILQNKPVSWVFSTAHLRPKWACDVLFVMMKQVQEIVWQTNPKSNSPTWQVGLIDDQDHGWTFFNCPKDMDVFLKNISKTVAYLKRSAVTGRSYNETSQVLDPGKLHRGIVNLPPYPGQVEPSPTASSMPLHHIPICVRTDMVQAMTDILAKDGDYVGKNLTLASPIESVLPRPRDVAHFYPPTLKGYRDEAPHVAKLRLAVSQTILNFAEAEKLQGKNLDVFANTLGATAEQGRKTPQQTYIKELLRTKIVVLAQRDVWEDHWRFFEAVVSGAMVMSDTILAMPAGMVDGESVVLYHNLTHLQDQLRYYLDPAHEAERISIAKTGRFVAMDRHRSWHRMELIALGEVKSTCSVSRFPECPFTVHAT